MGVERRELILYNNASKEIPKNLDYTLFVADQVVFGLKKALTKPLGAPLDKGIDKHQTNTLGHF